MKCQIIGHMRKLPFKPEKVAEKRKRSNEKSIVKSV